MLFCLYLGKLKFYDMKKVVIFSMLLILVAIGCKTTKTQRGAAIGAGAGAVMGAVIGKTAGNTAAGAVIGATVGGVAGAIIGKQMDKQAEEIKKQVPDAEVIHNQGDEGIVVNFSSKVLFDFDKFSLTDKSKATIRELSKVLNTYAETDLVIQGHTDSKGTEAYNLTLSENRAGSVADYLKAQGVRSSRIKVVGYGETSPVASNETAAGRAENRRVTFVISPNEKMKQDAAKEANK
jgi:outer membrane protein OmpA-like peptidoglycan-associated protein